MSSKTIIALTGGIGAGKSVVAAILRNAGYSVYDCDERAKGLMNTSIAIRHALEQRFGEYIYCNGNVNRDVLSAIIFNDSKALAFVNSVVHPAVRDDIERWALSQERMPVFIETAILKESGLDIMVDEVWNVVAPIDIRIERVIKRNNTTREKVLERINSQHELVKCDGKPIISIINDGTTPLLPQVMKTLERQ